MPDAAIRRAFRALSPILLAVTALPAAGADASKLKPEGYVSDFARVIDGASRAELERLAGRVEARTGVQMAFVTIDSLGDQPITEFANDLYRAWGIGQKGKDEGLLLLLVIGDRQSRLEVGRGLEPYITDGTAGSLLRDMRPYLRQNQFGEAVVLAGSQLLTIIAEAKNVDLAEEGSPQRRAPPPQPGVEVPWPVLLGGLFLLFWLLSLGGRRRGYGRASRPGDVLTGILLGNLMNRGMHWGGGRSSGGGFGGYDSGDSFGGFGGGDSGGGGASSNW